MFRSSKCLQKCLRSANSHHIFVRPASSNSGSNQSNYEYYARVRYYMKKKHYFKSYRNRNRILGTIGFLGTVAAGFYIYNTQQETVPISG